ncbi:hypothetical protein AVEN_56885-1 [Araneus ventricosus]|uniref:Integrase zinc-binding domain-containing protein n=1 Tax=Araneus ventricosus TaxID=182803 RepID=A0A4Y2EV35_ARAVE|nr:hypothetical protein AVEN_56885-1 [Araneus ventricosus]
MGRRPVGYLTSEHVLEVISCSLAKYPTGYRAEESRSLLSTTQASGEPTLSEKESLIKICIEAAHAPHFGVKKAFEFMRHKYQWKGMYLDTKKICENCKKCLENKPKSKLTQTKMISKRNLAPGQCIAIKIFGKLPRLTDNKNFISTILDHYSSRGKPGLAFLEPVVFYERDGISSSEERRVDSTQQRRAWTRCFGSCRLVQEKKFFLIRRASSVIDLSDFHLESGINSVGSAQSESVRPRRELRNLTQKYNAQVSDISLYLAMFERQAPTAEMEESELVSQLMALLPLDLAQIIIKKPEDKIKGYLHIREVL